MSANEDSLDQTVEALAAGLLRYCLARLWRREAAEDVAQETLAALVSRWRRVGPPDEPEAWVFSVARRRCARRRVRDRLRESLDGVLGRRDPDPGPEERAAARGELARVLDAIRGLERRDREVLLLVVAGGVERRHAARALGVSESALKMRLHRARRRLATELTMRDDDEGRAEILVAKRAEP